MPRVFISHSSLDHELVERDIISPLRANGVETWYSTDNIKSASEWERQIRDGLKKSDWFLIVLSPRSVASEWVEREVHWAFLKRKERIVPVMLETCEPDDLHLGLLPLQFIDFRGDVSKAQDRLLEVWGLNKSARVETLYSAAQDALAREDWGEAVGRLEDVLRLDPSHSQAGAELERVRQLQELAALYEAGLNDLRNGRWRDSLRALRRVRDIDGDYKDVADSIARAKSGLQQEEARGLYRKARAAAEREEWAEAAEQFEAVLKLDPSHADAQAALVRARQQTELAELYASGREHLRAERWGEALTCFRKVRAIDKGYGGVSDLIAEADAGREDEAHRAEREEQQRKAKEEAERRDAEAKADAELQERERREKQEREQESQARQQLYREALEAFDREDLVTARGLLLVVNAADPDNEEITARLSEVDRRQRLATMYDDGLRHMKNGRWAEAVEVFRQVRKAGGGYKDVSAQIALAEAELKSLGDKERQRRQAIDEAGRKEREEAGPVDKKFEFGAWRGMEQTTDAASHRRRLIKILAIPAGVLLLIVVSYVIWLKMQPVTAADFYNRAVYYHEQGKRTVAEPDYRKAIALDPNNAQYHYSLALALSGEERNGESEAEYRKAIDLNPGNAEYRDMLGYCLDRQGKLEESAAAYLDAINLDPNDPFKHYSLANVLKRQGKLKEAEAEEQTAKGLQSKSQ